MNQTNPAVQPEVQRAASWQELIAPIGELWACREVAWRLIVRGIKVRYANSVFGILWSFLNPLLLVGVLTVVFKYILHLGEENYSVKLFSTYIPWMFFSQALADGASCIGENIPLIKKIHFPRHVLPFAALGTNLVHFVLGMCVLFAWYGVVGVHFYWRYLLILVPLAVQLILTWGLMLILSALGAFYSDVRFLLGHLLTLMFFLSPVVYPAQQVLAAERIAPILRELYFLNPMVPLLAGYRGVLMEGWFTPWGPFPGYFVASALISCLVLALGVWVFRRMEWRFPERG